MKLKQKAQSKVTELHKYRQKALHKSASSNKYINRKKREPLTVNTCIVDVFWRVLTQT